MASTSSAPSSNVTTFPAPFSFEPSGSWDGNDGNWSSFTIQVGTPPESFRVFPSTSGDQILVPLSDACSRGDANCSNERGIIPFQGSTGGFVPTSSSSWVQKGNYASGLEQSLGYHVNAQYGLDTVTVSTTNSPTLSSNEQVVAGFIDTQFYLGLVGLTPDVLNLAGFEGNQDSWLKNLVLDNKIPSQSYGYTAGSSYTGDLGSLTLGGYDSKRIGSRTATFNFRPGSTVLESSLVSIAGSNTLGGSSSLLSSRIEVTIDSTLPYLWLPPAACDAFQDAFGLTYDNTTDLYTSNATTRQQFLGLPIQQQPSITFVLQGNQDSQTLNIVLPYAALDLVASFPTYSSPTHYFPIRRAANDSQYTLGRTFLQEAYVIVDYTRQNFTIAEAVPSSTKLLIPILPPGAQNITAPSTPTPAPAKSGGISTGAIAGIAVAAVVVVAGILLGLLILQRRKQRYEPPGGRDSRAATVVADDQDDVGPHTTYYEPSRNEKAVPLEMPSPDPAMSEVDGEPAKWGTFGAQELETPDIRSELPSPPLSWVELEGDGGSMFQRHRSQGQRSRGSDGRGLSVTSLNQQAASIGGSRTPNHERGPSDATIDEGPSFMNYEQDPSIRQWVRNVGRTETAAQSSRASDVISLPSPPLPPASLARVGAGNEPADRPVSPDVSPSTPHQSPPSPTTSERPPTLRMLHDHPTNLS